MTVQHRPQRRPLGEEPLIDPTARVERSELGPYTWIGPGSSILESTFGDYSYTAGAVVTKDVDPYTIAVGVPAKPRRPRFPKHIAEKLLVIAWWDRPREVLEQRFAGFNDLDRFLAKYG